jgi:hypothetical protein
MNSISRRDFFVNTVKRAVNKVRVHELKAETKMEVETDTERDSEPRTEVVIGRIMKFPLGEKKFLPQLHLAIESLPEGIRAQSTQSINSNRQDKEFYSIKVNQFGELVVNFKEIWSENQVFSLLTNEPTYTDSPREEQS